MGTGGYAIVLHPNSSRPIVIPLCDHVEAGLPIDCVARGEKGERGFKARCTTTLESSLCIASGLEVVLAPSSTAMSGQLSVKEFIQPSLKAVRTQPFPQSLPLREPRR